MRSLIKILVGAVLLTSILVACKNNPVEPDPRPIDFVLEDLDGNEFALSSTQGKVVILTFFAPWCPVCQSEAPVLTELHKTYAAQGLEIVSVAVQAESIDQIRSFKSQLNVPYRILVDDGVVSGAPPGYNVTSVPTTYIIDRQVNLYGPFGHLEMEQLDNVVRRYL